MKQRSVVSNSVLVLLVVASLCLQLASVQAQVVARVAAKEHVIEKKSGGNAVWLTSKIGDTLSQDNRFRTRKRSKADILFVDKSLIRLGPLSTLFVQNATETKLDAGALLFSRLTPGRIVAGAGIAGIKGSVGTIQHNADGSVLFSLNSGAMDVDTIRGDHISLLPDQSVLVFADGALSALRVAAPLIGGGNGNGLGGGGGGNGLGETPVDSPYAGSTSNTGIRSSPERQAADQGNTSSNAVVAQNATPFQNPGGLPVAPPIVVFPAALQFRRPIVQSRIVGSSLATTGSAAETTMPDTLSEIGALSAEAALAHIGEATGNLNGAGVADFEMIGALGDGGIQSYGGRLHTFYTKGPWSLDAALLPLKLRFNGAAGRVTRDLSTVSSASLTYTNPRGEIQVGRQRFLAGPTQAALFGSLVRQGARDTMDALRISPNVGKGRRLDLAYLYDAFPNKLPYNVPGGQNGYYGRFGVQTARGNYGLNLLHYNNLTVPTTTGASVDFALPLVPNQIEFYGELGRDTFSRGLTTFGLTFPGLYDRTDFDVYLETANLKKWNSTAPIPPSEYSLRVYRKLTKNSGFVAQFQQFYRSQSSVTFAFSYGAHVQLPTR